MCCYIHGFKMPLLCFSPRVIPGHRFQICILPDIHLRLLTSITNYLYLEVDHPHHCWVQDQKEQLNVLILKDMSGLCFKLKFLEDLTPFTLVRSLTIWIHEYSYRSINLLPYQDVGISTWYRFCDSPFSKLFGQSIVVSKLTSPTVIWVCGMKC